MPLLTSTETTATLVRAAQSGSDEAFERLVGLYNRLVFSICFNVARNQETAEDAAQDAFLSAWRHIGKARPECFKARLCRIASNSAKTHVRNSLRRIERPIEPSEDWPSGGAAPEDCALWRAEMDGIVAVISRLPKDMSNTVSLRYDHGLDYSEIASVMRTTIGTVKSRLSRSRSLILAAELIGSSNAA